MFKLIDHSVAGLPVGRVENSGNRQQLLKALFVVPSYSLSAGISIQTIIRPVPFSSAINPAYGASLPTLQPMIGYQCSRFTNVIAGRFSFMEKKRGEPWSAQAISQMCCSHDPLAHRCF
jgi:hypothetical protein